MRDVKRSGSLRVSVLGALVLSLALSGGPASDAPVADAAMRGDVDGVKALIREGADVNAAQGDGMTALHWAASNDDARLAEVLLYAGANPEAATRVGAYTPLHVAARSGSAAVVGVLLENGVPVDLLTATGVVPLHLAAESGDVGAVAALLDGGADVNVRDAVSGQTPLMFAVAYDRLDALRLLLERGSDPRLTTRVTDFKVREKADNEARRVRQKRMDALQEAAEAPAQPPANQPRARQGQAQGQAARQAAAPADELSGTPTPAAEAPKPEAKGEKAEEEPEEKEPDPLSFGDRVGKQGGMSALHYAARDGRHEAALALLAAGADVNEPTAGDHSTPLLVATINGQYDLAMHFLDVGADPNVPSDDGATPLFATLNNRWAPKALYPQPTAFKQQRTDYLDMLTALLEAGADPDARLEMDLWYTSYNFDLLGVDMAGATPFWRAAYAQDVPAMKLLRSFGADPGMPTKRMPSRRFGRGNDEADKDKSGVPPIPVYGPAVYPIHAASGVGFGQEYAANAHRGVPGGWLPAVRYLVEEVGVDVNLRDHDAYTALHHAASRGDNPLVLYLVAHGADVTLVSREGQTTVDMANGPQQRVQPYPETVALLESLGGVNNHKCVSC